MIVLRPTRLHWIRGEADDPLDLCAHSPVEFSIDGTTLIDPIDGEWCVSAAALYLLRTLSTGDAPQDPYHEHLFPHCGHAIYEVDDSEDVLITGCNVGIDLKVVHTGDAASITSRDGVIFRTAWTEWVSTVCGFSDAVQDFYARSSAKTPEGDYEERVYRKFVAEWSRRRSQAGASPTY